MTHHHYPAHTSHDSLPEWRRIMVADGELFSLSCCCLVACFLPNVVQGLAAHKITGSICHCIIPCLFYPFVACCYRSFIKRSLGLNMDNDSCIVNCLLHYFCASCATGQEHRAATAYIQGMGQVNRAIPNSPHMY